MFRDTGATTANAAALVEMGLEDDEAEAVAGLEALYGKAPESWELTDVGL